VRLESGSLVEALSAWHIGERWFWIDPYDSYWSPAAGAPVWWIEAVCCEPPVANESRSWTAIKELYR
jgi:hypothetical protein